MGCMLPEELKSPLVETGSCKSVENVNPSEDQIWVNSGIIFSLLTFWFEMTTYSQTMIFLYFPGLFEPELQVP